MSGVGPHQVTTRWSSLVEITLRCNLLKTQEKFAWLGVRDGIRNWMATAA
jgi:hypothetical protein